VSAAPCWFDDNDDGAEVVAVAEVEAAAEVVAA